MKTYQLFYNSDVEVVLYVS